MPINDAEIERKERELAELKRRRAEERGRLYDIIMRVMTDEERETIFSRVTEKQDRIALGLEAPEVRKGKGAGRSAASGGEEVCPYCGKSGLTERGLKLHISRMHPEERARETGAAA